MKKGETFPFTNTSGCLYLGGVMKTQNQPWTSHRSVSNSVTPAITQQPADARDLRTVAGRGELLFQILVGGDSLRPVRAAYAANSQLRAEQLALAWTRTRWAKDSRSVFIVETEIVD
jgi:hypothetical protein